MTLFIFGNGNISFENFTEQYIRTIDKLLETHPEMKFIVCEFRGTDTLVLEYLKTKTPNVTLLHIGDKPRYKPDTFNTHVKSWNLHGGFISDIERDSFAIKACTHFLAYDFNSNEKRISGTQKNIERCVSLGKIAVMNEY